MAEPHASRPLMPDYGVSGDTEGLLPWSWAEERLAQSYEVWVASVWPDGRPHVMPVWAVWLDGAVWFSTGRRSRKGRNLVADPRCSVITDDTRRPLIIEGNAETVTDRATVERFAEAVNGKYGDDISVEFLLTHHVFRVRPTSAIGMEEDRFNESPTRWTFTG